MANVYVAVPDSNDVWGREQVRTRDLTFDGTVAYVNGTGFTLQANDFGLKYFRGIVIVGMNAAADNTLLVGFVIPKGTTPTSLNARLYSAVGTELANGLYTAFTVRLLAYGG